MSHLYMHECGKPAFRYLPDEPPVAGEVTRSVDVQHLDGRKVEPFEPISCDSCAELIRVLKVENLVKE